MVSNGIMIVALLTALAFSLYLRRTDRPLSGRRSVSAEKRIFSAFGVDPKRYRLIATDLGDTGLPKVFLRSPLVVGVPDAIFESRHDRSLLIGEAKSRKHRGAVRKRERFQLILYMGVAAEGQFAGRVCRGRLAFADGVFDVAFDRATYAWLLGLVPAVRAALHQRNGSRQRRGNGSSKNTKRKS